MRYSKGMEFAFEDLLAVQACMGENLYSDFLAKVRREVTSRRIAVIYVNRNGVSIYRKQ